MCLSRGGVHISGHNTRMTDSMFCPSRCFGNTSVWQQHAGHRGNHENLCVSLPRDSSLLCHQPPSNERIRGTAEWKLLIILFDYCSQGMQLWGSYYENVLGFTQIFVISLLDFLLTGRWLRKRNPFPQLICILKLQAKSHSHHEHKRDFSHRQKVFSEMVFKKSTPNAIATKTSIRQTI